MSEDLIKQLDEILAKARKIIRRAQATVMRSKQLSSLVDALLGKINSEKGNNLRLDGPHISPPKVDFRKKRSE
jgi:hypothetical protein